MSQTEITANIPAHEHSVTVGYDFGDNVEDAIAKFGGDVVLSLFRQAATVNFQSVLRRYAISTDAESGEVTCHSAEDVAATAAVAEWKPGVSTRVSKSPRDKAMEALSKMSADERLALLAELEDEG